MEPEKIYEKVQERYSLAAKSPSTEYGRTIARAFGYSQDELSNTLEDANLGLSCGNPFALAKLRVVRRVSSLCTHFFRPY
jgi:arsenite methyltransferase